MAQWNETNRISPEYITRAELDDAIKDISPLNEEELDELFPINTDNNEE